MDVRQVTKSQPRHYRFRRERGFTFLEVMVALMLLAAAAGLLIGLQSAAVRRSIRDTNAQEAMLVARRIMASIEAMKGKDFNLSNQDSQPVQKILQEFGIPQPAEEGDRVITPLLASITVEDWILPVQNAETAPMKKISVKVAWGDRPDEAIHILYLMAAEPA